MPAIVVIAAQTITTSMLFPRMHLAPLGWPSL